MNERMDEWMNEIENEKIHLFDASEFTQPHLPYAIQTKKEEEYVVVYMCVVVDFKHFRVLIWLYFILFEPNRIK